MSEGHRGRLVVEAPFTTSELSIFDANLDRYAEGVGYFEDSVPAGLYRVGARLGNVTENKLVRVPSDGHARIGRREWSLRYDSTAPALLRDGNKSPDLMIAELRSSAAPKYANGDCRVFIFISMDAYPSLHQEGLRQLSPGLLTLCNQWGDPIADADWEDDLQNGRKYATLTAELYQEGYCVRYENVYGQLVELPLWPSPYFETHLFVRWRDGRSGPTFSFSMVPKGQGFNPGVVWSTDTTLLTEMALDGLRRGRNLISNEDQNTLLEGKFRNPWFGIIGAHLLLLDPSPDLSRIRVVVENLRRMVGAHPDVEALASIYGGLTSRISFPPTLRASLALLLDGRGGNSSWIEPDSLLSRVAFHSIADGPWLTWRPDAAREPNPGARNQERVYQELGSAMIEVAEVLGFVHAKDRFASSHEDRSEVPRWHTSSSDVRGNLIPGIADSLSRLHQSKALYSSWFERAVPAARDLIPDRRQMRNNTQLLEFIAHEALNRFQILNYSDVDLARLDLTPDLFEKVFSSYFGQRERPIGLPRSSAPLLDIIAEEAASLSVISIDDSDSHRIALTLAAIATASRVERPFAVGRGNRLLWIHPILNQRVVGGIEPLLEGSADEGRVYVDVPWRQELLRVRWYSDTLQCANTEIKVIYFRTWRGHGLPPRSVPGALSIDREYSRKLDAFAGEFRLSVRRAQLAATADAEDALTRRRESKLHAKSLIDFLDDILRKPISGDSFAE